MHRTDATPQSAATAGTDLPAVRARLVELAATSRARPVWVRVGTLFTGTETVADGHLVFTAREVLHASAALPDRSLLAEGVTAPDATLASYTALPCLIEAHAHLFLDGAPVDFKERERYLANPADHFLARARPRLARILLAGIGAIRDAGDKYGVGLALSAESRRRRGEGPSSGEPLPHLDSPGPALHHRGRYGAFMGEAIEDHGSVEAAVAARVAAGADRIKLLVSGIINFKEGRVTTPPQMPVDEVRAIVAAARSHGRQTFAHASGADGVEHSIEGGVTTVEHGFFVTDEQLRKMRDRRIGWCPTFAPVQLQLDRAGELGWDATVRDHLRRILDDHARALVRGHELGVAIIAGSDAGSCGVPHAVGLLHELHLMQQAGLPASAVLRAATAAAADVLGFPDPVGRLAPGHCARFILTPHPVATDVALLASPKLVIFDGAAVHSATALSPDGL